jgi:hypothetical protein
MDIAKLTAVITGGGYKRAATKDEAAKRFVRAAAERKIAKPESFLAKPFVDAKAALEAHLAGPKVEADPDRAGARKRAVAAAKAPAKARAVAVDAPDFRVPAKVDALMLRIIDAIGPAKVGKFRAEWAARDPQGYGRLAPTQQKGVMRKSVNRLVAEGKLLRNGPTFQVSDFGADFVEK